MSQISVKAKLKRRDVTKQAPERLIGEGSEVNVHLKPTTIFFNSDVTYNYKMRMVAVVFLALHMSDCTKESSNSPKFPINSMRMVKEDAEVFTFQVQERRSCVGLDIIRHLPPASFIIPFVYVLLYAQYLC